MVSAVDIALYPRQNGSMMGKSPDPFLPRFFGKGSGYVRLQKDLLTSSKLLALDPEVDSPWHAMPPATAWVQCYVAPKMLDGIRQNQALVSFPARLQIIHALVFMNTKDHANADAFSRLPQNQWRTDPS